LYDVCGGVALLLWCGRVDFVVAQFPAHSYIAMESAKVVYASATAAFLVASASYIVALAEVVACFARFAVMNAGR
jgi:hypothetical protein